MLKLDQLNSKAFNNAMEQIHEKMKNHKDQYLEIEVSKMEEYAEQNNLHFDRKGNII